MTEIESGRRSVFLGKDGNLGLQNRYRIKEPEMLLKCSFYTLVLQLGTQIQIQLHRPSYNRAKTREPKTFDLSKILMLPSQKYEINYDMKSR